MGGVLLIDLADQAIVVEALAAEQSGEFYLAIFGDFMTAADIGDVMTKKCIYSCSHSVLHIAD